MNTTRNIDIDRMRGVAVFLMLIVNSPIDLRITNSMLMHSDWEGLTLADTIFPMFLFIVGVSLTLSRHSRRITLRVLIFRAIFLVVLGLVLKIFFFILFEPAHFKIMGVLQRIGLCYAIVGVMYYYMSFNYLKVLCLMLFVMWSGMLYLWGDYNQFTNISDVVDNFILGVHANYFNAEVGKYGDSEGILSTIGAIITTLLGVLFGEKIKKADNSYLLLYCLICIVPGLALFLLFSMPVVKKLWTPSFILINSGISICVYLLLKKMSCFNLTSLEFIGRHSLAMYFFSVLVFYFLVYFKLWHFLFIEVYTFFLLNDMPIKVATLIFSLLFSSILCFTPYLIQKIVFYIKRSL